MTTNVSILSGTTFHTPSVDTIYGYNMSNMTTATTPAQLSEYWKATLTALEVVIYIITAINLWVFLSMIAYGTKTGRWRKKPGSSSLGNGIIYVACVVATGLTIPKLVVVILLYQAHKGVSFACRDVIYISPFAYFAALYATYVFLWIVQRRIYTHPSVKTRVNPCIDRFSQAFIVVLSLVFLAAGVLFGKYGLDVYSPENCTVDDPEKEKKVVIPITAALVALQIVMLVLCVYPAFRARFPIAHTHEVDESPTVKTESEGCLKRFCMNISHSKAVVVSPIQAHVKRSVINAIIIVLTDILASVANLVSHDEAPIQVQWFSYDLNLVVNVFCMLATFGFASQVVTLCCPTCLIRRPRKRRTNAYTNSENQA